MSRQKKGRNRGGFRGGYGVGWVINEMRYNSRKTALII
jgi:hypothetical protein